MEQFYIIKMPNGNYYDGIMNEGTDDLLLAWQFKTYREVSNVSFNMKESHDIYRADCKLEYLVTIENQIPKGWTPDEDDYDD